GLPTTTDANEFEIEPVFTAASPPSVVNPLVPATPATSPVADAFAMVPLFKPTSPPLLPFAPTLTATSVAEMLLIVPAFVPASTPTNWEPRPLTVTSARLTLQTTPVLPIGAEQPHVLGCGRDRSVRDGLTLAVEQPGEIRDRCESLIGIEGNFRSQRVGAGRVGSHGIEIADGVNQHVGRQLRRLIDIDENAASARARRTEVIRWILVFARLGSAWVIKDGDRSSAMRIVDVTTGIENDRALSRAGVVGTQSEITGASVRQLAARHE